jgi:pimeloyl-ACP methyl ester carboxylesterase
MDIASIQKSNSTSIINSTTHSSDIRKSSTVVNKPTDLNDSKKAVVLNNSKNLTDSDNLNNLKELSDSNSTNEANESRISISSKASTDSIALINSNALNISKPKCNQRSFSLKSLGTPTKQKDFKRSYTTRTFQRSFSTKSLKSLKSLKTTFFGPPPKTRTEKVIYRIRQFFTVFLALAVIYTLVNILCSSYEKNELKYYEYGTKLEVSDYTMIANVTGEQNEPVLVLLPEYGSASPVLYYQPLVETLSDKYKVVTMEPFGYGLSEIVDYERTIDKIVTELHTGVEKLGLSKYYLMGHSMGGMYSLYWSDKFTDEVLGFIGLDAIVPNAEEIVKGMPGKIKFRSIIDFLGYERMISIFSNRNLSRPLDSNYKYTDEDIKMFRILTLQKGHNELKRKEINALMDNMNTVKAMKFPKDIPVLNFICSENVKKYPKWKQLHLDVGDESKSNEVIEINGDNANFAFNHKDTISKKIKEWIK